MYDFLLPLCDEIKITKTARIEVERSCPCRTSGAPNGRVGSMFW